MNPVEFRQMASAFLFHNRSVLMMKKTRSSFLKDPFWTGLGGHLEADELNNPRKACLREIYEESGIEEHEIDSLTLKYILLRIHGQEVRQQFVYFGKTNRIDLVESDEGELHWIEQEELLNLRLSKIVHFMIEHYNEHPDAKEIMVGTITIDETNNPVIQWSELKDPLVF